MSSRANRLVYEVILGSAQIDWEVVGTIIRRQNESMRETTKMLDAQNRSLLETTKTICAGMELLGHEIAGTPACYAEGEKRVYVLPAVPSGGTVVSPSGEVLRPATIDDILRELP